MPVTRRPAHAMLWAFVLAIVTCGSRAPADVIFSNFGAGDSYQTNVGRTVGSPGDFAAAMYFDAPASSNYAFDGFDLAAWYVAGTDAITAQLMTSSGGLPGTTLESFSLTPSPYPSSILSATSVLHPTLTAGGRYWLAVAPSDSTTWAAWNFADSDTRDSAESYDGGATWSLLPAVGNGAFRIYGSPALPVPEPAFYQLGALLALGGLGLLRHRKRA